MYAGNSKLWRQRFAENPLGASLVVSIVLHLMVFGLWETGRALGWMHPNLPDQVTSALNNPSVTVLLETPSTPESEKEQEPEPPKPPTQMTFVDVDPDTAAEPPKSAKFYSAISSQAANPNPKRNTNQPELDGKQSQIVRTFDAPRPNPQPTQAEAKAPEKQPDKPEPQPDPTPEPAPAPQPVQKMAKAQPKLEPRPAPKAGRTETAPPVPPSPPRPEARGTAETLQPEIRPEPPKTRPRTIAAAKAQMGMISGEKSRQEGGVNRNAIKPSLDVIGSPFGRYDQRLIQAIQARWYALINEQEARGMVLATGKVVVAFRLLYDGGVSNVEVVEESVGPIQSILCQQAIIQPAKYEPWPTELRLANSRDYRDVRFTFFYN